MESDVLDGVGETETAGQEQRRGRFQPGQSGNPSGRPVGARNRATVLADGLLGDDAANIVRKVISKALAGDVTCLRLCLERLVPPVRDRAVSVDLPAVVTVSDAVAAMSKVVASMAAGEIAPTEAAAVAGVVETFRRTVETQELDRRIAELEQHQRGRR